MKDYVSECFTFFQVIIHDAVRPFVDEQILKSVSIAAKEHGVLISIVLLICGCKNSHFTPQKITAYCSI